MKTILLIALSTLVSISGAASASGESSVAAESASPSTGSQTYQGSYNASTKTMSIDIDGLNYKGNYASITDDSAGSDSGALTGKWGRAFLLASSARTLRCQLDEGFPKVSGKCQDAGGRQFQLTSGVGQ